MNNLQFFTDRIGQTVYRAKLQDLGENTQNIKGVRIVDERHAKGLYELEQDFNKAIYFDSKEEADKTSL